jgi:hypothetical protein
MIHTSSRFSCWPFPKPTPGLLGSDSIRSGEGRTRLLSELRNAASVYQESMQFESLSNLKENLDRLLKIGEGGATACWEAPIFDKYSDLDDDSKPFSGSHLGLTITSTLQGQFVYWKGMEPSKLLEYDSRLVAFTRELPFQGGKPLSPIVEEREGEIVLVDHSSIGEFSPERHVYMASIHEHGDDDEPGREYDDELLADVSTEERTADAPQDEDEECKRIRRAKNAKHAKCRRNTEARSSSASPSASPSMRLSPTKTARGRRRRTTRETSWGRNVSRTPKTSSTSSSAATAASPPSARRSLLCTRYCLSSQRYNGLLRCNEAPISFSREDQWTKFSEPGKFLLVLGYFRNRQFGAVCREDIVHPSSRRSDGLHFRHLRPCELGRYNPLWLTGVSRGPALWAVENLPSSCPSRPSALEAWTSLLSHPKIFNFRM